MKEIYIFLCFMYILINQSCNLDQTVIVEEHYKNYYPIDTLKFKVFLVDSTYYNSITGKDTLIHYQQKDEVLKQYTDNQNRLFSIFSVQKRFKNEEYWNEIGNYSIYTSNFYVLKEENAGEKNKILFFPPILYFKWNFKEEYSTSKEQFSYTKLSDTCILTNKIKYTKCIEVTELNSINLIDSFYTSKTYSFNLGLIEEKKIKISKQPGLNRSGYKKITTYWYTGEYKTNN